MAAAHALEANRDNSNRSVSGRSHARLSLARRLRHMGVEGALHQFSHRSSPGRPRRRPHGRDVTFGEHYSRIRTTPVVFARLRSFGFDILKANRAGMLSQDRYPAALGGFDRLSQLVTI